MSKANENMDSEMQHARYELTVAHLYTWNIEHLLRLQRNMPRPLLLYMHSKRHIVNRRAHKQITRQTWSESTDGSAQTIVLAFALRTMWQLRVV